LKRITLVTLILILILQLTGCTHNMVAKSDLYSQIRIGRLADQGLVTIGMETEGFEDLLAQLTGTLKRNDSCKADHVHKYLISLLTYDEVTMAFYMDEEGNLCQEGKRYASHKKEANPIKIEDWDAAFEKLSLYTAAEGGNREGDPEVTAKNPPKHIIGTENATDKTFFVTANDWNYYAGHMPLEGSMSLVLWREDKNGNSQRLLSMPQPEEENKKHTIEYVENSLEKSDSQFLFFTIQSGASMHKSLWQFNVINEKLGRYLDYPCSNMIFTELTINSLKNRGWIAQYQNIMAIDMQTGFLDYDASMSLRNVIDNSIFYEPESETLTKQTVLTDLRNGILGIDVITYEKETGRETHREHYKLNVVTKRMLR